MPLHHPDGLRERILSFGPSGTGKTHDIFEVAKFAQSTGSAAKFYYVDTDDTVERMRATEFKGLANIVDQRCFDWEDITGVGGRRGTQGFIEQSLAKATRDDWLVVDLLDPTWQFCQDFFTDQVFSKDLAEFFVQARAAQAASPNKGGKDGGAFEGWKDWPVINGMYKSFCQLFLKWPGHVYATATAGAVNRQTDGADIIDIFGQLGFKPNGQKGTAHFFHTVILKKKVGEQYKIQTAKDRGRPDQLGTQVTNFAMNYLVAVGGWRP